MAAANHGKAVEWVERIAVTVFSDVFLIGGEVFAVPVHVRQGVHKIVLEHLIHFPGVGPQLIVEIAVAQGRTDNHAVIAHDTLMPDDLGRDGLHQHNGIGTHALAVMEKLGHAEYHYIILLFSPRHIGPLIRRNPGVGLHDFCISAVNLYLTGPGVQHCVTAEKLLSHAFFHVLANLIKFCPHKRRSADRSKILPVHDLRYMVGGYGSPMGDARGAVLIPSGVAAVGVALGVSDQDCHIAVIHIFIHEHRIAAVRGAQVHQMLVILAVMVDNLMRVPELMKQLIPKDVVDFRLRVLPVKSVGTD